MRSSTIFLTTNLNLISKRFITGQLPFSLLFSQLSQVIIQNFAAEVFKYVKILVTYQISIKQPLALQEFINIIYHHFNKLFPVFTYLLSGDVILQAIYKRFFMMDTNSMPKNFYPPRFTSFRRASKDKFVVALMEKNDNENLGQKHDVSVHQPIKRYSTIAQNKKAEFITFSTPNKESLKSTKNKNDYMLVIDNMQKRIKNLMREATGLMQLVLQSRNVSFDEKTQERIRMTQDKDVEREYRALKEKLTALRRQNLLQSVLQKKDIHSTTISNPQAVTEKCKRMKIKKTLEIKLTPETKSRSRSHSSKREEHSHQKTTNQHQQKHVHLIDEHSHPIAVAHHKDHQTKRAEHYKHKFMEMEQKMQDFLHEKSETNRINEEMSQQIVKMRAQMLSYKYQFMKK